MNRIFTAAAVAALTAASSAAMAADLPRRTVAPAPVVQAAPMFTWTGFYAGLVGGYVFDTGRSSLIGSPALLATGLVPLGGQRALGDGFTIGGTLGFNYQIGNFVAGVETDLSYVDLGRSIATTIGPVTTTLSNDMTYFGTLRGRLGVAFDRALIYATGGLAYGDGKARTTVADPGAGQFWTGASGSSRFGYTLGAGLEYAFTNNISAKVEYLYYDLGRRSYNSLQVAGPALPGVFATTRAQNTGNIIRAGLNYRF